MKFSCSVWIPSFREVPNGTPLSRHVFLAQIISHCRDHCVLDALVVDLSFILRSQRGCTYFKSCSNHLYPGGLLGSPLSSALSFGADTTRPTDWSGYRKSRFTGP